MSLKTTFNNAAETIFKVFKSLIVPVNYVTEVEDGFGTVKSTETPVDMIIDNFAERDVQYLSFSRLIQPTDVKGLIRGKQLRSLGITELDTTSKIVRIDNGVVFSIVAYDTDPAEALYTVLLRGVV